MPKRVLLMALGVFIAAMLIVQLRQASRLAFSELQVLVAEHDRLEVERGQFLLEEAAFSESRRVDELSRSRLALAMPGGDQVVLVRGDAMSLPPVSGPITVGSDTEKAGNP
jgi:cell division protein FtsL